jgi:hypothetical protein
MKRYFGTTLILLSTFVSCRQSSLYSKYNFSDKILDNSIRRPVYFDPAQELSYIGEYEKMLETSDKEMRRFKQKPDSLTSEQKKMFSKFKAVNAKDLILEKAKTEQIIIINEAHQQPYHRVFTTSLLHDLYAAGFRYFSAETLTNFGFSINKIQKNKFPTINSGYYTREPFYANLIREAVNEGFEIFGYETNRIRQKHTPGISQREIDQAMNIKKILDKDPKAKILIHCGHDHIVETPYPGWGKAMAGRLYEYTGINPFTIDQVMLTEHSSSEYQNPTWSFINLEYYAMFVDSTGQTFANLQGEKRYDARVYHPKTKLLHGRPHWVFENNRSPYYVKEKINLTFPCLIFAFLANERKQSKKAIPFDIIELKSPTDEKALSLKKGQKFTIVIRDVNLQAQKFDVTVD